MPLFIKALRIRVATRSGDFGTELTFGTGLNVIRANNTSGKSTTLMSLVYALGLEGAFAAQQAPPLPQAMTQVLEYHGQRHAVVESRVEVELANGAGEVIRVSRDVKSDRDKRMITVSTPGGARRDFFVRIEGAAQRERGFHWFLAQFVGWNLPAVPKYDDTESPLYVECLVPFFMVEQKAGWSQIEPKLPTRLGIRDMHARAVEFLLKLDMQEVARVRAELKARAERIRGDWTGVQVELSERARVAAGALRGYPVAPTAIWPPSPDAVIVFGSGEQTRLLADELTTTTGRLDLARAAPVPTAGEAATHAKTELEGAERAFGEVDAVYREAFSDLESERAYNKSIDQRLQHLEEDLRKYRDLERLRKFGSTEEPESWRGTCPTCHQHVDDALLPPNTVPDPMSLDENIKFIEAQIAAFKATKAGSDAALAEKTARNAAIISRATETRGRIRALRETLVSASNAPSIASVREIVLLEERKSQLERLAIEENTARTQLDELSADWARVQDDLRKTREGPSESDLGKVDAWTSSIRDQLRAYGFQSIAAQGLEIAWGSFRLQDEGSTFEKGISASDMIRCHWAYLLGLLELARDAPTNHPQLLIFDEPKQQSAADMSFSALLRRAAETGPAGQQMIVATSQDAASLGGMLTNIPHKLRDFGSEKILQPLPK